MSDLHETRVLAGYKAAYHNPNTSAEAKDRAEEVLREAGVNLDELGPAASSSTSTKLVKAEATNNDQDDDEDMPSSPTKAHHADISTESMTPAEKEEHTKRVLAGFKATLHNARTSESAKAHAREKISEIEQEQAKHHHHVVGGYKATLHNARTSAEAKAHARSMLEEMGVDPDEI